MNMHDSPLLSTYADAQSMLARIEERRKLSPVRRAWKIRCFVTERQALAWIDATMIDPADFQVDGRGAVSGGAFDLTHWRQAVGAPITLETMMTDSSGLLDWLGVNDAPLTAMPWAAPTLPLADIQHRVQIWQRDIAAMPPAPPLLHGARIAQIWRQQLPIGRGDAVAGLLIGDRYGPGRLDASFGGLVALGFQHEGSAWKTASPAEHDHMWLNAIIAGARQHLDHEIRLRAYAVRAADTIEARRRPGRLKDVILMAMANPYVTSRQVADRLNLTSAGAIKLLTTATDTGLLLERSGQSSYRTYSIPLSTGVNPSRDAFEHMRTGQFWNED